MHNNTNIGLPTASDSDQQQSLYSKYYDECCTKGGVCIQLCGWIRATHLVKGHACNKKDYKINQNITATKTIQRKQ